MPTIVEITDITLKVPEHDPSPAGVGLCLGLVEKGMEVEQIGLQPTIDSDVATCSKIGEGVGLPEGEEQILLKDAMLNYLANSKTACFKSQQTGEPELQFKQKRQIACDVLTQSPSQFLARFGKHLQAVHMDYFNEMIKNSEAYEVAFQVKQLRRFHCEAKRKLDVRNRRYGAMKKLIVEGTYFNNNEMKKRNPLLYDNLVAKYLSPEEIDEQARHSSRMENATLLDILLQQIEEDQCKELREMQAEAKACEELDTSDEDEDDEVYLGDNDSVPTDEEMDDTHEAEKENEGTPQRKKKKHLSRREKAYCKLEFFSQMYDSFLDGNDKDFDYSQVDDNEDYDNLSDRDKDEEEKYFDAQTPNTTIGSTANSDTEDELDVFMKNLKPEPSPHELSDKLERM